VHSRIPTESGVDLTTWWDSGGGRREGGDGERRRGRDERRRGREVKRAGRHAEITTHCGLWVAEE
jgi:hypothetical protein